MLTPLRQARPLVAVGLIRVSKARDDTTSPDVQRHAIEALAKAERITIIDWVEGIDESGSRAKSAWWPRLDQTIARMEAGEINTIMVWRFSRTARHRLKWAIALDKVDTLGGLILSATEPIESTTASGKFARGLLGEVNAYQADLIGEGWRETLERRVRNGLPGTGRPRFGYTWDTTYTPDPATAPVVQEMYRRSIAGHGMATITRWVNSLGHRTRHGNPWATANITRYMDHGFAAGLIWSKGTLFPGAHEPIIDTATWDAYLARRASTVKPPRGRVRMLSGLLRCGTCGGPMMATRTQGDTGSYGCAARARGQECAQPMSIERHVAEQTISQWILNLPEHAQQLRAAAAQEEAQRLTAIEDRAAIGRLITRAEERLSRLTVRLLDESISQSAYDATAATLNSELAALRQRFARTAPRPRSDLLAEVPRMVEGWPSLEPAAQNRVARALITRGIVGPGRGEGRITVVPRWETNN